MNTYLDPFDSSRTLVVTAEHREFGDCPHYHKAPHDDTLLEAFNISHNSTANAFCATMANYISDMHKMRGN